MKKISRYSLYLLAGIVLAMALTTGCGKDDNPSRKELLTAHSWTFDKVTTTSTDTTVLQGVALINAFLTNSTITFHTDGTYTLTSPLTSTPETGTWELSTDEKLITIKSDSDSDPSDPSTIVTLTDSQFVIEENSTDDNGKPYTLTIAWKK